MLKTLAIAAASAVALLAGLGTAVVLTDANGAPHDDRTIFCSEFLVHERASWEPGKVLAKWANANPGEVSRFNAFADGLCAGENPALPSPMVTMHGLALVAVGELALDESESTTTETTEPTTTETTTETDPPPPPPASVFVSPNGSDSNPCSQSSPCLTWNRGYQVANPGEIVSVAAGVYGEQFLAQDASHTSSDDVVFEVEAGTTVARLWFGDDSPAIKPASHVTINAPGLTLNNSFQFRYVSGVRAQDITIAGDVRMGSGSGLYIRGAKDISISGLEIGPICCSADGGQMTVGASGGPNNENITLDRLHVHDIVRVCADWPSGHGPCPDSDDPSAHIDGFQWGSGQGVTITNSRFYNIATQELFFNCLLGGRFSDITLVNNMFANRSGDSTNSVNLSDTCAGQFTGFIRIFHNSVESSLRVRPNGVAASATVEIRGNIVGSMGACQSRYSYSENVAGDASCSADGLTGTASFVSTSDTSPDLHLQAGSLGLGLVTTALAAADMDGDTRTLPADAGADER